MEELGAVRSRRLHFIDGLRGIAAVAVALFHFYVFGHMTDSLARVLPHVIVLLLIHGDLGVSVCFVISGFVMALSQRNARIDLKYLGNFAIRRSLRLDPPYWITLWAAFILNRALSRFAPSVGKTISVNDVVVSMFYLQTLLRRPVVLNLAWTLCYEVQFYLVLTILCMVGQRFFRSHWHRSYLLLFLPSGVWSLAIYAGYLPSPLTGLFIDRWYMFVLGVLACWTWEKRIHTAWFWGFITLAGVVFYLRFNLEAIASVTTAAILGVVSLIPNALETGLSTPSMQFFGRISYSIYLVHGLVGVKLMQMAATKLGASSVDSIFILISACSCTIAVAWILYSTVEKFGIRLGAKLKRRPVALSRPLVETL